MHCSRMSAAFAAGESPLPSRVPVKGMVTMVDLGAHKYILCKMMIAIIQELNKEYKGKAAIQFIDVWEHREEAHKYGIPYYSYPDFLRKERGRDVLPPRFYG